MNDNLNNEKTHFSINQLSELSGFSVRNIRFYVQKGLIDKPIGLKRAAYYEVSHLEQVMLIKKGQDAGYSLERIHQLIHHPESFKPVVETYAGALSVKTHITLAQGVELVISPEQANLNAEQLREFARQSIKSLQKIMENENV